MLKIQGVTKVFDETVKAVNNLSLEVKRGEVYCMLGANGAGKTTTINLILNFIEPNSGQIFVNDIDVMRDPLAAKKHVAFVSENVVLYENFTAMQNLDFFSKLGGQKNYTKDDYHKILSRVGLDAAFHRKRLKTFSKGMRQKAGIAIAIAKNADLILLDEPTSGLDPKSGREFLNILGELRKENKAILMTTHDIFRAKEIADRLGIMVQGSLVKEMDRQEIEATNLEEVYMKYVDQVETKVA
jgi:ABC-2 type transport system ATP-binding protein